MLQVQKCKYLDQYQLSILFNNGSACTVNLHDEIMHEPYKALQNVSVFKNFFLDHGAICWLNGQIDMAVEYLFFLANKDKAEFQELFKQWGYRS